MSVPEGQVFKKEFGYCCKGLVDISLWPVFAQWLRKIDLGLMDLEAIPTH